MARIALVHDIAGVAAVQAELLRGAGHDVEQVALPTYGASWKWPAKALALPIRLVAYLPTAWRLRRGHYDVIHIHFLSQGIVGVLAGRPFFVQAHGSDVHANLKNLVYRWVTGMVLTKATAIFYVTPNLPSLLEPYRDKLVYLPNPVDTRHAVQPAPAPTRVRRVVIFTRLHPVKGVDLIFASVEQLRADVEVTAFDSGPLAGEYRTTYRNRVKFVKPIPHEQIWDFLSGFDVVIGQMRQGVLGLMEIEALAAARPVIAAVGLSLYAADPPPVVPARGPGDIVSALRKLDADPGELARLSRLGPAWVERNHSRARHLEILEHTYGSAISTA